MVSANLKYQKLTSRKVLNTQIQQHQSCKQFIFACEGKRKSRD